MIQAQEETRPAAFPEEDDLPEETPEPALKPDSGGVIRWVYEQPMTKSFFLLSEVWRVFAVTGVIVLLIDLFITLVSGGDLNSMITSVLVILGVLAFLCLLSLPAYWIVTKANNGKYTVLFEMDENSITHTQIKTDKAKALDLLAVLAGQKIKNPSVTAAGLLSASGTSLTSQFRKVKKIHAYPEQNLIKLNSALIRNQVYADDESFDAVLRYIVERCPDAEVR